MPPKQEPVKCANGHVPEPEPHAEHSCDLCKANLTCFCCRQCNYDMCLKCARGVKLPLSADLLKRALPEYDVSSAGDNVYNMQKGDVCLYSFCGGVCPEAFFKYKVAVGNEGVTVENDVRNMGMVDPRPIFVLEALAIRGKVLQALMENLVKHEAYLKQAEIQKAALAGGSVPAQQVMTTNLLGSVGTAATAPTPQVMGQPDADLATQLEKLVKMHESGVLTDEEFQQAKKGAIAKCSGASS
eukprot:TRINITY_DN46677_c0_g1_i1.p1 TRINITY_DN46677_c0_g1~~TRINITY_DN46677_c0_g1_i1.p1  ORF type:complete len:281 (-),score=54.50 TRINITY_DN46677_c0_g1_i1:241-966(-)